MSPHNLDDKVPVFQTGNVGLSPTVGSKYTCSRCKKIISISVKAEHDRTCEALASKESRTAAIMKDVSKLFDGKDPS